MLQKEINKYKNNKLFTKNELKIANFILNHFQIIPELMSIKLLAQNTHVSISTITRFFNKIGENGYKGFVQSLFFEIKNSQSLFLDSEIRSIIDTKNLLNKQTLKHLAKLIQKAPAISLYASGFSYIMIQNFEKQLNKINIKTQLISANEPTSIFSSENVHLFVSISGKSEEMMDAIIKLKSFNVPQKIFSITSTSISNIKKYVQEHIHGVVYNDIVLGNNKEFPTTHSRVLHFILDKIFQTIYLLDKDKHDKFIASLKSRKL